MYIDSGVSGDCINADSYGQICVGCGCCGRNPNKADMFRKRIEYYEHRLMLELIELNLAELQHKSFDIIKSNIAYYEKKIADQEEALKNEIMTDDKKKNY